MAEEITFRQKTRIASPRDNKESPPQFEQDTFADIDGDDEPEFELEHFKCLALQHKTKDYVATVARYPETLIFVHV